ncbi:cryptochrome/photolyase family protein, partial [Salmonella enterica subsp. enterica serovar Typhi]|nr:cryptochrome/photolyase family protein [Salmonella enterica subsp. enterica serovar Typhi]
MILYLTSEARVNLLDFLEKEQELPIKKLTGGFSLLSFVIKDMRHFAHVRYVTLDRAAITESDEELIQALLSYQTIYDIRVVLIVEGLPPGSPFLQELIQIGILNIVTATE